MSVLIVPKRTDNSKFFITRNGSVWVDDFILEMVDKNVGIIDFSNEQIFFRHKKNFDRIK